jgi:tRNA pseudouridine38-40 synthase
MPRFAAGLEYDGRAYSGWQFQPGLNTVQDVVQRALSRVADAPVEVVCAGRTDAGVHASEQVLHFDSGAARNERAWRLGANTYLPGDVSLLWVREVPDQFHARFSATARSYRYLILNRDSRPGLDAGRATWERRPLDAGLMHASAQALVGEHDFSAFRAIECQSKSPVRRVESISVSRESEWLRLDITANAFLHHMVRNVAGLLMSVGEGESQPARVAAVLASRDRRTNAATAPPDGLYLAAVRYPAGFGLPVADSAQSAIIRRSSGL